jgi:hemerythrin-like domain-containing protein
MPTLLDQQAAPGFDDPLGMLHACHQRMDQQLQTLDRLRRHVVIHHADADARIAAGKIIRYFTTAAPHHHVDEEASLFPRLVAAAPEISGTIAALARDHAAIDAQWRKLLPRLSAIVAGAGAHLPPRDVIAFCDCNQAHIAREERDVLGIAAELLDVDTLAVIGGEMAARRQRLGR